MWRIAYRHGQDEFEHSKSDGRCVDESPAGEDKVCEGALAGVAMGKLLMRMLVVTAKATVLELNEVPLNRVQLQPAGC